MVRYYPQILRDYVGEERARCNDLVDETTKRAALVVGASQSTSGAAKGAEPNSRKERARYGQIVRPIEEADLKQFANDNKIWLEYEDFKKEYDVRKIGAGAEQEVYLSHDCRKVVKVNTGIFHSTWLDYFNRLLYHSFLFPSTGYSIIGFTENEEGFAVVTEQPFFILQNGAPRTKVEQYLHGNGFRRSKNDDYYNGEIGAILEDLHDENVFVDEEGNLIFIDPVIYIEAAELGLGGKYVFRFPFNSY